jgi:hypothetical protein
MLNRRNGLVLALLVLFGGLITFAVRGSDQTFLTQVMRNSLIKTAAVATYEHELTATASARPSGTPTETPPPPSATPNFTATASQTDTPTPSCYRLRFLKDLSIPDGAGMSPGQAFTKSWFVQNTGACPWLKGFVFSFYGGDAMGGSNYTLPRDIPVGTKVVLSIDMTAPDLIGPVIGSWRMAYRGWFFGDTLTVKIQIGTLSATSTP